MKKLTLAAVGLGAVAGLSLLIDDTWSNTAYAASNDNAAAGAYEVKGQIVNMGADRNCIDPAGVGLCSFDGKGLLITEDGEVIERQIIGTMHRTGAKEGVVGINQSYAIWTHPDGSQMLTRGDGVSEVNAEGQRSAHGSQTCIGGTGRYAEVDCTVNWAHSPQDNGLRTGTVTATITPKAQS